MKIKFKKMPTLIEGIFLQIFYSRMRGKSMIIHWRM
ncbi:hypothetical protein YPPY54_0415, partial [Yersinia pestis PY-54]